MKRFFKTLAWSVLGLLVALLLVVLAWVASNWHDAEQQLRPAALAVPAPQLPDEVNSFDGLVKLSDGFSKPRGVAFLSCRAHYEDCASKWMKDLSALADAHRAIAALGARCDALMGDNFEYEEKAPPFGNREATWAVAANQETCADWWLSSGVLAWTRGDKPAALVSLLRADRLQRGLAAGSQSGIGASQRIAHKTLRILTGIGLRDPEFGRNLLPMLAPLPDPVAAVRRWIVYEAAWRHNWASKISRSAVWGDGESDSMPPEHALQRRAIAWHPNRTAQLADARSMRWLSQLDGGLIAAIRALQLERAQAGTKTRAVPLSWHDVTASIMMAVNDSDHPHFLIAQADLELHRELAVLALTAQVEKIPAERRRDWVSSRPLSDFTKDRLHWDAEGRWVETRTWESDWYSNHHGAPASKIRIAWPATIKSSKH
jgi:hypothetical protein